jgi:hypothetical protein
MGMGAVVALPTVTIAAWIGKCRLPKQAIIAKPCAVVDSV